MNNLTGLFITLVTAFHDEGSDDFRGTTIDAACYKGEFRPVMIDRPKFELVVKGDRYHFWIDNEFVGVKGYEWLGSKEFVAMLHGTKRFSLAALSAGAKPTAEGKAYPTFDSSQFVKAMQRKAEFDKQCQLDM